MKSARFNRVFAWQKAHQFVLATYRFSSSFPATERYGLTAQLRRAAVSIPANFVEGFRRSSLVEKIRFNNIAQGSGEEARYYLILAADLGYGDPTSISAILDEALSLLEGYTRALRRKLEKQNLRRELSGMKAMK